MEHFQNLLAKIETAERIFRSKTDWKFKYDTIFGLGFEPLFQAVGLAYDWLDPDKSYDEDVTVFMEFLQETAIKLQAVLNQDT